MNIHPSKTIVLLLSAGGSSRMGFPKALLPWKQMPLLKAHLHRYLELGLPIRLLTGAYRAQLQHLWQDLNIEELYNPEWHEEEQRHSILKGISGLHNNERVLLSPIDTAVPESSNIELLLSTQTPAALAYRGSTGHPILAEVGWLREHLDRPLCEAASELQHVEASPAVLANFNTPEAWEKFSGLLAQPISSSYTSPDNKGSQPPKEAR
jgi:CTP:molybdopterin cytidylyltransferase MocA